MAISTIALLMVSLFAGVPVAAFVVAWLRSDNRQAEINHWRERAMQAEQTLKYERNRAMYDAYVAAYATDEEML